MMFSNSVTLKTALVLAALVGLAACDGRRGMPLVEDATFYVDSIGIKEAKVSTFDSFELPEKKEFQFQACLIDAVARSGIVLTDFVVSDGNNAKQVKTEVNGCLLWTETHRVSSLQKDRMLRIRREFRGVEAFAGTVVLELAFNPWTDELHDLRKFTPPYLDQHLESLTFDTDLQGLLKQTNTTMAEAYLTDVALNFIGHDKRSTKVNNQLTLKTAQKFRMVMSPQFLRRNLKNQIEYVGLKGGQFNVSLVILKNEPTAKITTNDLVAEYQGTVTVDKRTGIATKDIILRIHDTAAVLSRNHVLVTLEPTGEAALRARSGFYTGYIDPLNGNGSGISLVPAEGDLSELARAVDTALADARQMVPSSKLLADYSGLKPVAALNEKEGSDAANSLVNLVAAKAAPGSKGLAELRSQRASYCDKVYSKDEEAEIPHHALGLNTPLMAFFRGQVEPNAVKKVNALTACRAHPEEMIAFEAHDLVESINGDPKHIETPDPITISIDRSTSLSRTEGSSTSASFKVNAGIGMSKAFLQVFSVGFGADWGHVRSRAKSKDESVSTGVSQGHKLAVVSDVYEINANVKRCATAVALYGNKKGYYSCEDNSKPRTFRETYYLVNHGIGNSGFTDENAATSTNWRMTIRGEGMYKDFETMMTQKNAVLEFSKVVPFVGVNHHLPLLPDFKVSQSFPGAIPAAETK